MPKRDVEEWFWQFGGELRQVSEEMRRPRPHMAGGRAWEPRVDLIEERHRLLLKADLAGVRGDDIQLLYIPERHALMLRGVRMEEDPDDVDRTGIHLLEIFYGDFQREIMLPDVSIDADGIRATFRNGMLLVMIPKKDRVVTRTVTIWKSNG